MSLPDQTPKLPKLPFLVGDAILLGAAWYLANRDPGLLNVQAIAAVTVCVVLAAVLGAIPFLTDYARKQDEALDERQRGLEALSRTINTAAEQISIAANGLNELTDLTHKNLKQAEQLPHKLQEKIAEFNAQLDNAREDDREELEKELAELRTSETERLQSVSEKVHKAVAELTRLEASVQKHMSNRPEQVDQGHATFSKAQADATAAITQAHASLARELAIAHSNALAEIDRTLAERAAAAVSAIESAVSQAISSINTSIVAAVTSPEGAESAPSAAAQKPAGPEATPAPEVASPPKRPRKARREEAPSAEAPPTDIDLAPPSTTAETPESTTAAEAAEPAGTSPVPPPPASNPSDAEIAPTPPPFAEPPPIPVETIPQIAPVAPPSAQPFPTASTPETTPAEALAAESAPETIPPISPPPSANPAATERPAKKRPPRPPVAEQTPNLLFELTGEEPFSSDEPPVTGAEMMERVISSDGATRLIATAYIGIGNRLFLRGDGPGLSWEKGVPLQFISIGKWRWETADATVPIHFKLYKNDEVECPGLGTLLLEPGHQQEVTAKF